MTREDLEKRCFTIALDITGYWDDKKARDKNFEERIEVRRIVAKYLADEIQKILESK